MSRKKEFRLPPESESIPRYDLPENRFSLEPESKSEVRYDLPESDSVTVEQFRAECEKLFRRQRDELERVAGKPADIEKIVKKQWSVWQKRRTELVSRLMFLSCLDLATDDRERYESKTGKSFPERQFQKILKSMVSDHVRSVSKKMTGASLRMGERAQGRYESEMSKPVGPEGYLSSVATVDENHVLDAVFGEKRAIRFAKSEIVSAGAIVKRAIAKLADASGIDTVLVWMMGPCQEHWEFCPMLHRTPESYWGRFVPDGPTVHPHCCCGLVVHFGTEKQLIAEGVCFVPSISDGIVVAAGRKIGLDIDPGLF